MIEVLFTKVIPAEDDGHVFPLSFDEDSRHCWSCSSAINKAAIAKVRRI